MRWRGRKTPLQLGSNENPPQGGFLLHAHRNDTIPPMSALWHPAICADWLAVRRTGAVAFMRIIGVPALPLAGCVALACGDFYGGYGWGLAAAALLALGGSYAIAHQRLLDTLERWRFGWCGALPVARGATAGTSLLVTAAGLIVSLAFVTALLLGASMAAPHRGDLPYALAGVDLALVVGTTIAAVRALHAGARVRHADGIREPLFTLRWLNDPRLPHLLDWQRRETLVRWRRGGSFVMVGVVLAGVPDGPSIPMVVALVLLVLAWAWLAVVMRASADASNAAVHLVGATPLHPGLARVTSLRYPLIAASCALIPVIVGTALGGRAAIALGWAICACAVSGWPLVRIFRATRTPGPPA